MQSYVKDIYKTSAWQDFKDEVEVRGKKPSIFLNFPQCFPKSLEIAPQSPKIWGSIEERLRNIEGFLPLNFTSCLAGWCVT
jgi:hypothetical protein